MDEVQVLLKEQAEQHEAALAQAHANVEAARVAAAQAAAEATAAAADAEAARREADALRCIVSTAPESRVAAVTVGEEQPSEVAVRVEAHRAAPAAAEMEAAMQELAGLRASLTRAVDDRWEALKQAQVWRDQGLAMGQRRDALHAGMWTCP